MHREDRNSCRVLARKSEGKLLSPVLCVDGMNVPKWILRKDSERMH
jgi:hypothetical protein